MNRMFRNTLCISSVLVTGSAFANEAVVTIETVAAVPGSTARIGITIDVNDLIGSLDFDAFAGGWIFTDVDYDGPLFDSGWEGWDTTSSAEPNVLAACIFPEDQVTGFQALFTMNIDVPADAEIGSFRLVDFTDVFVTNYQFTKSVAFRVAWTGLYTDNIGRASNTINYTLPRLGVQSGRTEGLFANGISVGVVCNR